jgi:RHS repeat-associated protein
MGRQRQIGSYITGIQYHANSLPSAYALGNGLTYTQTLNNRLWPQVQETKLGAATLQRYVYSYSNTGNLTFLDDQGDGSDDASLGYDNLHRLTSATGIWGNYGYTYDPLHNLRSRTGSSALTYSYDASNRISGISGAQTRNYAYNPNGEITGDGIKSFTLNADGQITNITGIASYAFDGNGKRIKATAQGGTPEYSLYGVSGDLLYSEKGAVQNDYVKLNGQTLVELRKSAGVTTPVYLHPDYLGSPRKATSATGAMLWQEHFDPYGAKLNGVAEKIGFTGHAQDGESGYVYMQARFYDPLVGRFLTTDPVHFKDENPFTFNRYAYGNNNPYKYVDPDGRVAWFIPVIFAITSLFASDAANGPGHGDTPVPQGGAARAGLGAMVPIGWGSRLPQTVVMRETAETITQQGAATGTGIAANAARGRSSEARVLQDLGLTKNTTSVATAEGRAIPDALTTNLSVEIKDAANVSLTRQLRIETEAARAAGRESVLVTGENTCISGACSRAFDTIIRRSDLGPK